jgi:hypothetical protein
MIWKFLIEGSVTRPPKSRTYDPFGSFPGGGLYSPVDESFHCGTWDTVRDCRGQNDAHVCVAVRALVLRETTKKVHYDTLSGVAKTVDHNIPQKRTQGRSRRRGGVGHHLVRKLQEVCGSAVLEFCGDGISLTLWLNDVRILQDCNLHVRTLHTPTGSLMWRLHSIRVQRMYVCYTIRQPK